MTGDGVNDAPALERADVGVAMVNSRFIFAPALSRAGLSGNPYVLLAIAACIALQLAFTHAPPMQAIFASTDLTPVERARVVAAGLCVFVIAELEQLALRSIRPALRRGRSPNGVPIEH